MPLEKSSPKPFFTKVDTPDKCGLDLYFVKEKEKAVGAAVKVITNHLSGSGNGSSKTDDVYLATFVYDSNSQKSEWVVYDGTTMSSEPVLRLEVPARVPTGFHGEWINEQKLQDHIASLRSI